MTSRMTPWQALHLPGWHVCWSGGAKLSLPLEDLWYLLTADSVAT